MSRSIEPSVVPGGGIGAGSRAIFGKLALSLFFLVFFAVGSLFEVLILREFAREMATYRWRAVRATVLSSGVEETDDDEDPYRLAVSYRYEFGGGEYTSNRVALDQSGSSSYDSVQRKTLEYRRGTTVTCYVDPARPEESVLRRRSPFFGLIALFPLIFVAIGAGGLYAVWRPSPPPPETVSISKKARSGRLGAMVPVVLGLIFVVVGGSLFMVIGVVPALRLVRAASWTEVPCTIVSSTVRSHSSDDGTTYKVDILYQYNVEDRTYRNNRYDFANFSSSGYRGKREIVDRYRAGSQSTCFVDPADPTSAVLDRGFRPTYLVGLLPLSFLVVGAAVARWGFRRRPESASKIDKLPIGSHLQAALSGPATLTAKQSPAAKVTGAVVFSLFWNGIVSVFLFKLVGDWQHGHHDWFLALFLVPFVLVGLASVAAIVYFALAAFNPRPRLTVQPTTPRLGSSLAIDWRFTGGSKRIDHLKITLEGREEATYQRGTDTHTDREVFARVKVADASYHLDIARGSTQVQIPEDTMHSLTADNNRVVWTLKVKGNVPRWPDVDEEFEINVLPMAIEEEMS